MSRKERERKSVFDEVKAGRLTQGTAAQRVGLSYRQCRRSYRRFVREGDKGLMHRSRGRSSNRGKEPAFREQVVERYVERYDGFGPTLAAEKLGAENLPVDHETLRRWLIAAGRWNRQRRRAQHRQRRERKGHFGELVQMDGSHHAWFGEGHGPCCLINLTDDATGHCQALMTQQETSEGAMVALRRWIERHGIVQALYTDRKNVYVTDREPTLEEQLAGEEPKTAFGKACAKLDIAIIEARSPQAKGRVERKHGVFQDRFVKELYLRGVTTIEGANQVLDGGFVDELNAKFARPPASGQDYHRPVPKGMDLAGVFCFEDTRTLQNDWTIRHENQYYQIEKDSQLLPKPKDKIMVRRRLDGAVELLYKDRRLNYHLIEPDELHQRAQRPIPQPAPANDPKPAKKPKPAWDHPWRTRRHTTSAARSQP